MSDRLRGIAEFAYTSTLHAAEGGGTGRYSKLARKLNLLADTEISAVQKDSSVAVACHKGCDACCHRLVAATGPELVSIHEHISATFTPEQIEGLKDRIIGLAQANADFWNTRLGDAHGPCPFLVRHECSIYEHRPILCRSLNALDAKDCEEAYIQGAPVDPPSIPDQDQVAVIATQVVVACRDLRIPSGMFELGPSIGAMLENPAALQFGLLERYKILSEFDREVPSRHPLTEAMLRDPAKKAIVDTLLTGTPAKIWDRLKTYEGTPFGEIYRLQIPTQYASQDELEFWWDRFGESLSKFEASKLPARETFELLQHFHTFNLAYCGKDVKPYMARFMNVVHRYASEAFPDVTSPIESSRQPGKPRVGFISYRIKRFNGSRWSFGWLKHLSPEIETIVINLTEKEDKVSFAFRRQADRYIHAPGTVAEVAPLIRSLDLDALIFTDVGMDGHSLQLASLRLACRQMNSWGHPVTSGSPTMDDYLSSIMMESENGDLHYTERLQRLPGSGVTYPRIALKPSVKTHAELGVPESGYFLCCQMPFKITPNEDHFFTELSARSNKPIVIIGGPPICENGELERRLRAQKVNAIFIPRLERADYLRLLQLADTSLDLPSWHGGNTTIEAMALGTPVVSLPGEFMRGRHALAFLNQANVSGLIAADAESYIELALDLDRQREIMKNVDVDALYEDPAPARAISEMILRGM